MGDNDNQINKQIEKYEKIILFFKTGNFIKSNLQLSSIDSLSDYLFYKINYNQIEILNENKFLLILKINKKNKDLNLIIYFLLNLIEKFKLESLYEIFKDEKQYDNYDFNNFKSFFLNNYYIDSTELKDFYFNRNISNDFYNIIYFKKNNNNKLIDSNKKIFIITEYYKNSNSIIRLVNKYLPNSFYLISNYRIDVLFSPQTYLIINGENYSYNFIDNPINYLHISNNFFLIFNNRNFYFTNEVLPNIVEMNDVIKEKIFIKNPENNDLINIKEISIEIKNTSLFSQSFLFINKKEKNIYRKYKSDYFSLPHLNTFIYNNYQNNLDHVYYDNEQYKQLVKNKINCSNVDFILIKDSFNLFNDNNNLIYYNDYNILDYNKGIVNFNNNDSDNSIFKIIINNNEYYLNNKIVEFDGNIKLFNFIKYL